MSPHMIPNRSVYEDDIPVIWIFYLLAVHSPIRTKICFTEVLLRLPRITYGS